MPTLNVIPLLLVAALLGMGIGYVIGLQRGRRSKVVDSRDNKK